MTKQTFTIPEGCKVVTVEQVGNRIITTFEPEFKRGDVLIEKNVASTSILIFDRAEQNRSFYFALFFINGFKKYLILNDFISNNVVDSLRHATPEESQPLWDALAKDGKRWNPETMQVEPIKKERWRAKNNGIYYSVDMSSSRLVYYSEECSDKIDDRQYKNGNYFQTKEQAHRAADRLKAELDKFWEEELR